MKYTAQPDTYIMCYSSFVVSSNTDTHNTTTHNNNMKLQVGILYNYTLFYTNYTILYINYAIFCTKYAIFYTNWTILYTIFITNYIQYSTSTAHYSDMYIKSLNPIHVASKIFQNINFTIWKKGVLEIDSVLLNCNGQTWFNSLVWGLSDVWFWRNRDFHTEDVDSSPPDPIRVKTGFYWILLGNAKIQWLKECSMKCVVVYLLFLNNITFAKLNTNSTKKKMG